MLASSALLLTLLSVDVSTTPVREDRATAVWIEPQLRFHAIGTGRPDAFGSDASALPLGLELGHMLGRRTFLSLAYAELPLNDGAQTLWSAGVRVYFRDGLVAPYAAAALGFVSEQIPDAQRTDTNPFAMAGPGLELATRIGVSVTTDLLLGAENRGDGPDRSWATSWHLSGFYRLGLGYRF